MAVRYPRPAQLDSLGQRHAVVEASAGTGKTYLLEHLVVDLILRRGATLEEILVVTFTEKATAELVQRVRAKLQELRDLGPDDAAARTAAGLPDAACWVLDQPARARLGQALLSFDRASISTIHGFCQRVLTEYAFSQQRLFDEEAVDEGQAFHGAFIEGVRFLAADATVVPWLDAYLGGGGTLAALERWTRDAWRGLGCVFPPRPEALRPRVDDSGLSALLRAFPEVSADDPALKAALKAYKVHPSTASALLKRARTLAAIAGAHRRGLALPACLAAMAAEEELWGNLGKDTLASIPSGAESIGLVLGTMRTLAGVSPLGAAVAKVLPSVMQRLEARKRAAGLYDFQDMLTLVARGLEGNGPRQQALIAALRARWRWALVDECQDTDEVQWSIFRRLFVEGTSAHVLTLIGDPKQAIYAFRGADVHTYLGARSELVAGGGAQLFLDDNFRSTAPLIGACNAILEGFFRPGGGIAYDRRARCGRPATTGTLTPPVVVLDVQTEAPQILTWQVKQAVLARMVVELRDLMDGQARPSDVFVLTRTTRESREVGDALRGATIPFAYYKQDHLFRTVEAREVLDLLRAIADPDDRTARARAWITGFFGLALPELASCDDLPPTHGLVALLHEWKALADAGDLETMFARIVQGSGIVCREVFVGQTERRLTNTLHLLEVLQAEAARSRGTVRELANTLGAYINGTRKPPGEGSDLQRLESDANAVQIMTVHHSKGLEAKVVFLYGGFWPGGQGVKVKVFHDADGRRVVRVGQLPADEQARCESESEDEERRVLYVALTRAKERLYLPRYPAAFKTLKGTYAYLNERLHAIGGGFTAPGTQALFASVAVPCPGPPPAMAPAPDAPALARWTPTPAPAFDDGPYRRAAELRAGFVVTSYSAVKRRHGGFVPIAADEPTASEAPGGPSADETLPDDELPRGRLSGSFLHALLEEVPLDGLRELPALGEWASRPAVRSLFERLGRRHDRQATHLPHAARLVHTALTADVALGATRIPGLASTARVLRELEFLYPIPEATQPLLGSGAGPGAAPAQDVPAFRIERGVVKGYIDVLFEHEGRVFVCDWKGDWLPAHSWAPAPLAAHCARNYDTQARLYTVAALRLLGISDQAAYDERFGGVAYLFLRGMRADHPEAGVHFHRPSWDTLLGWQREMLRSSFWGLS